MHLDLLINENYKNLNNVDLHVLHFIKNNVFLCTSISIADLAKHCNVSTSTVLRTTRKLNFSGYSEFKYFLKNDIENVEEDSIDVIEILSQDITQTIKVFKQNKNINNIYKMM